MNSISDIFLNIKLGRVDGEVSNHKPLLLILMFSYLYDKRPRLISFVDIDNKLSGLIKKFCKNCNEENTHYPFGKLENDGFWEIENSTSLKRTSVRHLYKSELLSSNIHGGFVIDVYNQLINDDAILRDSIAAVMQKFFEENVFRDLLLDVGIKFDFVFKEEDMSEPSIKDLNVDYIVDLPSTLEENKFVNYVNSLHSLSAGGANALAESQALNSYFSELYIQLPLVDDLYSSILNDKEQVFILTGHAGDGKSTIALDIYKRLKGLPPDKPLITPLKELEVVAHSTGTISIVKDMSELSAERRRDWLQRAFHERGSWLIVSNTGPLLSSMDIYINNQQENSVESNILDKLDRPFVNGESLQDHTLLSLKKPLVIVNLARIDNIKEGAELLEKLLKHSGWNQCHNCSMVGFCPIQRNRQLLLEAGRELTNRVRWIYLRIAAYEQRLTFRQMIAHLALSITGGIDCKTVFDEMKSSTLPDSEKGIELFSRILFSESFFGYRDGDLWKEASDLKAISLLQRMVFGRTIAVDYDHAILSGDSDIFLKISSHANLIRKYWSDNTFNNIGIKRRFSLRRLMYFGLIECRKKNSECDKEYFSNFLQSQMLIDFDEFKSWKAIKFDPIKRKRFLNLCLNVLLELYSGYNANQFDDSNRKLYITMKRPESGFSQSSQLIIASFDYNEFILDFDVNLSVPVLVFTNGNENVKLLLHLPLLDFISYRANGELGGELSNIHFSQLEMFMTNIIKFRKKIDRFELEFLNTNIDGFARIKKIFIDKENFRLEFES